MRLKGKKAIVTGANRSIGQAIAVEFARQGADVVVSYRSDEAGAIKTIEAVEKLGQKGKAIYVDFSKEESAQAFFDQSLDFLKKVDILVNNAAGYDTTEFLGLDKDVFKELLDIGVVAPMLLTQMVSAHMIDNGIDGSIINVSSISGLRPYPNRVAHSTAKAALNMLTKNTALELAKYNIRVNGIAPGATPYDLSDQENLAKSIPLKRVGLPEDQAKAAVFLASDDSSWMTGHIMVIDGGQSL